MQSLDELGAVVITKEQSISGNELINDANGVVICAQGSFNLQRNSQLTLDSKITILQNKQLFFGEGDVIFNTGSVEHINVIWFGANPDDNKSDVAAIQKAIDAAIMSPGVSVVYFPPGIYTVDKPILALSPRGDDYAFFNLTLKGHQLPYNNPGDDKGGVSVLKANSEIPFILGIQAARGVEISNMAFDGYMSTITAIDDLIYKSSNEIYKQNQYAPLSAIVIDPFSTSVPPGGGYKGLENYYNNKRSSTRILIENSSIENFPTGISITPNGETKQADSVAINFTRFKNLVNGIVICQTQSRNVVVDNCSFHRMKYAFNSVDFGEQQGILPEVNNIKIADGVAWIFNANGNVAYGHFRNVYAESLYGIGYSRINKQPLNFEGCVFKFRPVSDPLKELTNPSVLTADNASFTGCTFTIGGGNKNVEPLIMNVKEATFINCYFDTPPINIGDNLQKKNVSENLNSNLRKAKIATNSWKSLSFSNDSKVQVAYDNSSNLFYFSGAGSYTVGDFVFALVKLDVEPFEGKPVYTMVGKVKNIRNDKVYFKSNLLDKNDTTLKLVRD